MEATEVSINGWMDKDDVVHIYNRILAIKKQIAIFSNMDKPSVYPEWS